MKKIETILAAAILAGAALPAGAQVMSNLDRVPQGAVVYSLPSTTIGLKVTAEHESFAAGPYARYAQKYLGVEARTQSGDFYSVKSVEMVPYVEADPGFSAAVSLAGAKGAPANFLNFCSQGLVVMSDGYTGKATNWRFPSAAGAESFLAGSTSNLDNMTTTLYKTVQTGNGLQKVPVKQSQVVEKSLERKAEETAAMIFRLRQKRVDIITGDTDATFSGEAMAASLKEMQRLENEYMAMFMGTSVKEDQVMVFDVVPDGNNAKQMYIAFRLSDTQGLLPANNMQGRPFVLELIEDREPIAPTSLGEAVSNTKGKVAYRKPVTVTAKLMDGQKVLLQSRVPVYQFGKILTFPIETAVR